MSGVLKTVAKVAGVVAVVAGTIATAGIGGPAFAALASTVATYAGIAAGVASLGAAGRYVDGKKVFGIGLAEDAIDIAAFTAWGNVCEANGWKVGGVIFEPGDRWANLKRIMAAGSAEPIFAGGVLSVKYDAPRVSLVTITPDDYSDGAYRTKGMQTWRDRINTIIPKYRSGAHKWEYVESDAVTDAGYLAEDGEEKIDTYQIDLCQDKDQAAQLATYKLVNGREMFPIERNLKPEFRFYRPGDMVTIDDPEGGLNEQDCVIVRRSVDPQTLAVRWVLMSETADKHDFALGQTGTAPPTPTLLDPEDRDDAAVINNSPPGYNLTLIQTSYISGVAGVTLTSSDVGTTANIVAASHTPDVNLIFYGIESYKAADKPIGVWNMGASGSLAASWVDDNQPYSFINVIQSLAPHLCIICLTINDWAADTAEATYKAQMQDIIDACAVNSDILLVVGVPSNTGTAPVLRQQAFAGYVRDLATTNDLPVLDLSERWVSQALLPGRGLYYDGLHPTNVGYADVGHLVAQVVGNPGYFFG